MSSNDDSDRTVNIHGPNRGAESTDFELVPDSPSVLGDYDLLEELGVGGMGRVYKARERRTGRIVALKTLLPCYLSTPALVQRFQKEAEAAAHLDHPGIVPLYKPGEAGNQIFFTMALVEGRGLDKRLRQGPLDNRRAAMLVQRVAEAVAYAHRRGVVHRDLKPGNILMDREGAIKVTDFGLARRLGEEDIAAIDEAVRAAHPDAVGSVVRLTRAGAIMGTPGYMAPEQVSSAANVGPAADVWALGAILYACLTGRPPFVGADAVETLMLTAEAQPVPPGEINPDADPELVEICLQCLRKDPAERYSTADAVAAELVRWRDGRSALTTWEVWRLHISRFLTGAPELVPLIAGLVVQRLGNLQEGLFVAGMLAGVSWSARRRTGPRLALAGGGIGLFATTVGLAGQWTEPLMAGLLVSAAGVVSLLVLLAAGLPMVEPTRPNNWWPKRVGIACLIAGALTLALSMLADLGLLVIPDRGAELSANLTLTEWHLGRFAGWLLAVPLGLAIGALFSQVNSRLDILGRETIPTFVLGAAVAAILAAFALREMRPEGPVPPARLSVTGPGPALAVADAAIARWVDSAPEQRLAASAGIFCLKLLFLGGPAVLGAVSARLMARLAEGER